MNICFFRANAGFGFAALLRFPGFPFAVAGELNIRDDSGGGEDRGSVKSGGGEEAQASGTAETILLDFSVGIVNDLVIAGTAGVPGVVVETRDLLRNKLGIVFRWSLDAARRRVVALVSRMSSLSSLGIE